MERAKKLKKNKKSNMERMRSQTSKMSPGDRRAGPWRRGREERLSERERISGRREWETEIQPGEAEAVNRRVILGQFRAA